MLAKQRIAISASVRWQGRRPQGAGAPAVGSCEPPADELKLVETGHRHQKVGLKRQSWGPVVHSSSPGVHNRFAAVRSRFLLLFEGRPRSRSPGP
jgi:hypothetical protein